ncbi:MAG: permease [Pseudomonadota bacterium]
MSTLIARLSAARPPNLDGAWVAIAIILAGLAMLDPAQFPNAVHFAVGALIGTAPYIIFAVLLIAFLKASGAETAIARAFEGREIRMIFLAALFGGLAPFCSCEVIPFIAGLLAMGAPLSAIMAFWLASPLIDPPTLLITAAALGWPFAIAKAVAAVALGLFGGFAIKVVCHSGLFENPLKPQTASACGCGPSPLGGQPVWKFWSESARRETFVSASASNARFLLKWLALAYVLESLMITYVPAEAIARFVGGEGVLPIVLSALVGAPAYLNSYVAPPVVAGLMEQGMSAGAGMAFMVAGAVTSIPAMTAVFALVRPPIFASYVALGFVGAVLSGLLFNALVM